MGKVPPGATSVIPPVKVLCPPRVNQPPPVARSARVPVPVAIVPLMVRPLNPEPLVPTPEMVSCCPEPLRVFVKIGTPAAKPQEIVGLLFRAIAPPYVVLVSPLNVKL